MKKNIIYIAIALLVLSSCSSSIRFAENANVNKQKSKNHTNNKITKHTPLPSNRGSSQSTETNSKNKTVYSNPIVAEASKMIGTPYCYGGEDRECTDCSGFAMQVFAQFGIQLPRTAALQFTYSNIISPEDSKPGDLVFFSDGKHINHVGIYAGNGEFIHASTSLGVIKTSLMDKYYRSRFVGFGRILDL